MIYISKIIYDFVITISKKRSTVSVYHRFRMATEQRIYNFNRLNSEFWTINNWNDKNIFKQLKTDESKILPAFDL